MYHVYVWFLCAKKLIKMWGEIWYIIYAHWYFIFCDEKVQVKNINKLDQYNDYKKYGFFFLPAFLLFKWVLQFPFDGLKQQYNLIDSIGQAHCEVNGHHCVPYFTYCLKIFWITRIIIQYMYQHLLSWYLDCQLY